MKKLATFLLFPLFLLIIFSCNKEAQEDNEECGFAFGIDVSHYNGEIDWEEVKTQKKHREIKFVIVRVTAGTRTDNKFQENFSEAKELGFVVGSYHYYDPNQNSTLQAENFITQTSLRKGDIRPVLDIEKLSRIQSNNNLRKGLKNWLTIVEKHYGVKPIIYTGVSFYEDYLMRHGFSGYPLWVAAYSPSKRQHQIVQDAEIHQFSERVRVPGITGYTDGNDAKELARLLIK